MLGLSTLEIEDGDKVKSLLSWKRVGFTPLAMCYRPTDRLLMIGGENDRIKTFKLLSHGFKTHVFSDIPSLNLGMLPVQ